MHASQGESWQVCEPVQLHFHPLGKLCFFKESFSNFPNVMQIKCYVKKKILENSG